MSRITLIPDELLAAKSIDAIEEWVLTWTPTAEASMRDEMRAANDLFIERFVRHNASKKKFQEWLRENPRTFTTRCKQEWLTKKAAAPEKP